MLHVHSHIKIQLLLFLFSAMWMMLALTGTIDTGEGIKIDFLVIKWITVIVTVTVTWSLFSHDAGCRMSDRYPIIVAGEYRKKNSFTGASFCPTSSHFSRVKSADRHLRRRSQILSLHGVCLISKNFSPSLLINGTWSCAYCMFHRRKNRREG